LLSLRRSVIVMAAVLAFFHFVVVGIPVLVSGGTGETQAFAAALFDAPIHWLLTRVPGAAAVVYGPHPAIYMLIFAGGGTLMYAVLGAMIGSGLHVARRLFSTA